MKKFIFLFLCLISLLWAIIYYIKPYYIPAVKQTGLIVSKHGDDTIRIGFIGDSWAAGHKPVKCIIDSLVEAQSGHSTIVRIEGISGMTSKNIYYSMFRNNEVKDIIEWGPNFCVICAGINDSDRKMGRNFYKNNMRLIIELLLENNIVPVILEIPSYDIYFSFKRRDRMVKMRYLLSMFVTWSKMDCIEDYRNAYIELLNENGWTNRVVTIWCKDWNPEGFRDIRGLYDEGLMHLNKRGYHVLDSCIAEKIAKKTSASF
ncbi:MAG: SGNH/GDSL hydrolase family protein [Prevotella sp.]|nr:SGNH/GDSL hydrolase family protein [Prevotella sp.]